MQERQEALGLLVLKASKVTRARPGTPESTVLLDQLEALVLKELKVSQEAPETRERRVIREMWGPLGFLVKLGRLEIQARRVPMGQLDLLATLELVKLVKQDLLGRRAT